LRSLAFAAVTEVVMLLFRARSITEGVVVEKLDMMSEFIKIEIMGEATAKDRFECFEGVISKSKRSWRLLDVIYSG